MRKYLLICLGFLAIFLGTIGIFVPGMPTTPFVLLASWCFYNSSARLHQRLNNSFLGKYIQRFNKKEGVDLKTKLTSVLLMWCMISISIFIVLDKSHLKVIVALLGVIGTVCVLFVVPNPSRELESEEVNETKPENATEMITDTNK